MLKNLEKNCINRILIRTPATTDNSTKIATTAYVKALLGTVYYIKEKWSSGTSWYRVWSDGWIEQGGYSSTATITFKKAFKNTNYNILLGHAKGSGWTNGATANFYDKTTTTFKLYQCDGNGASWMACGY